MIKYVVVVLKHGLFPLQEESNAKEKKETEADGWSETCKNARGSREKKHGGVQSSEAGKLQASEQEDAATDAENPAGRKQQCGCTK